mmetsp:Transcript_2468/g.6098  ORF Transcript_2468/g.6098 Transcript_2468/m.6098 type:complete len:370 (+) Transcript_2468:705-1814(+)
MELGHPLALDHLLEGTCYGRALRAELLLQDGFCPAPRHPRWEEHGQFLRRVIGLDKHIGGGLGTHEPLKEVAPDRVLTLSVVLHHCITTLDRRLCLGAVSRGLEGPQSLGRRKQHALLERCAPLLQAAVLARAVEECHRCCDACSRPQRGERWREVRRLPARIGQGALLHEQEHEHRMELTALQRVELGPFEHIAGSCSQVLPPAGGPLLGGPGLHVAPHEDQLLLRRKGRRIKGAFLPHVRLHCALHLIDMRHRFRPLGNRLAQPLVPVANLLVVVAGGGGVGIGGWRARVGGGVGGGGGGLDFERDTDMGRRIPGAIAGPFIIVINDQLEARTRGLGPLQRCTAAGAFGRCRRSSFRLWPHRRGCRT